MLMLLGQINGACKVPDSLVGDLKPGHRSFHLLQMCIEDILLAVMHQLDSRATRQRIQTSQETNRFVTSEQARNTINI